MHGESDSDSSGCTSGSSSSSAVTHGASPAARANVNKSHGTRNWQALPCMHARLAVHQLCSMQLRMHAGDSRRMSSALHSRRRR